jgi:hypothetical protein
MFECGFRKGRGSLSEKLKKMVEIGNIYATAVFNNIDFIAI